MGFRGAVAVALVACASCAPEPTPVTPVVTSAAASASSEAPTPTATHAPPAAPPAPATVTDVLTANRAAFDTCFTRARGDTPTLGRTSVEMTFTIDADGTPRNVDLRYRRRVEEKFKECLRDAALALHFPASLQGQPSGTIVLAPPGP